MDNNRTFKNLEGDSINITYRVLTRKDALEIEYTSLGIITAALSEASVAFQYLLKDSTGRDAETLSAVAKALARVHAVTPFDVIWSVASRVLEGCVILGDKQSAKIEKLEDSDYFNDRLDELILATFWGLDVSFPRLFGKARRVLARFGEDKPGETTSKESNGVFATNT